jgi:hypothetical protein
MPRIRKEVRPSKVRYIKLGQGGEWEEECIEQEHTLRIKFLEADHALCLAGKWKAISKHYQNHGMAEGPANGFANQIREFYEDDGSALWLTFYKRLLWWCFSKPAVRLMKDKTKTKEAVGGWKCKDIDGSLLSVDNLSGKLLRVQGFRGTICQVKEAEYVLRKINGEELPETKQAREALAGLCESLEQLIQHLHWKDFEILVDLIFRQAGWQRLGVLGKTEKALDLELLSPVLGLRAFVQIKSSSDVEEFREYCEAFDQMPQFQQMFYVVHTPNDALSRAKPTDDRIKLILLDDVAKLTVSGGLVEWLIEKTS